LLDLGSMHDLLAVYVDGETKTGKGAASAAIADALKKEGLSIYYDVAGNFYRRYVAWVRLALKLAESDPLPTGTVLEETAERLYRSGKAFERDDAILGDLQRPAIGTSVSQLAELGIVQQADGDWCAETLKQARASDADVMVIDGRNPRAKFEKAEHEIGLTVTAVLDLYLTCEAQEAGRRLLVARGIGKPSDQQLAAAEEEVIARRAQDRNRTINPFVEPAVSVYYNPEAMTVEQALQQSWQAHKSNDLPLPIRLDNSQISKDDMLAAVTALATAAIKSVRSK